MYDSRLGTFNPARDGTITKATHGKKIAISASGCHEWTAFTNAGGYGLISVTIAGRARTLAAHRAAWMVNRGPIPAGRVLDHLCRVRRCVNVEHLEPVMSGENTIRGRDARRLLPPVENRPAWMDPSLWQEAKAAASERGESLSEVIRAALFDYVTATTAQHVRSNS